MRRLWIASWVLCCVACTGSGALGSPAEALDPSRGAELSAAQREVVDAVDAMFAAMREHDVAGLRALVAEGAVIVRLGRDAGGEVEHTVIPAQAFIAGTAGEASVIDERFTETPTVRIDGPMATLWGPYDVRVDGEFEHCGVDAVQLARLDGRWQVTAITYTQHPAGCP